MFSIDVQCQYKIFLVMAVCALLWSGVAHATSYTSTNFQVVDPVLDTAGGRKTSSNFILLEASGQNAVGISNSSNFTLKSGFLYFAAPAATAEATAATVATPLSAVPFHILPFIRPLLPDIPRKVLEEFVKKLPCPAGFYKEDLNCDGAIGLVDFSIFLFLQGDNQRTRPTNPADFDRSGMVDIQDLSILFSAWTEKLLTFDTTNSANATDKALSQESPYEIIAATIPLRAQELVSTAPQQANTSYLASLPSAIRRSTQELPRVRWQDIAGAFAVLITLRLLLVRIGL